MTQRHQEIIEQIKKDSIEVRYANDLGTPGRYHIDADGNCIIEIDIKVLNGSDVNFNDKRNELVLHHEWGHIKDYRKNPKKFIQLNAINSCHEDLEYEAYWNALSIAVEEAKNGDKALLNEALKRYNENVNLPRLNQGYKKALSRIFQSELWKEGQAIT